MLVESVWKLFTIYVVHKATVLVRRKTLVQKKFPSTRVCISEEHTLREMPLIND